ncbi:M56 family metallopeptidase [Longimonas halophila]|uniref:M56 family metallopeptidase n=1 Tax=Longimonas halophila TaxID=1469170 RepID=UPI0011420F3E|nr:M56 family metallopeptidase [Longimonas halophila]
MPDVLLMLDTLGRFVTTTVAGPVVLWTLVALAAWGGLRLVPSPPLVQYWTRVGVLLALPLGLAAALLDLGLPGEVFRPVSDVPWLGRTLAPIVVDAASTGTSASPAWRILFVGAGIGAIGAGGAAVVALTRLAADAYALHRFRAAHPPNAPAWVQEQVDTHATTLGITRPVSVCCAPDIAVPMTVGGGRPRLFLPESLCSDEQALAMTLTHELVHVQRFDYVVHVLVRTVRALFVAHPLVPIYARAVATYREQACDAAVLATNRVPRKAYATLLLQWTQRVSSTPASALGLAYSSSTLKSRISAMTSHVVPSRPALSLVLSALLLVTTFTLMACGDVGTEEPSNATPPDAPVPPTEIDTQPQLDGGMQALYSAVTYPDIAQEHGVEGRMVVQFVVTRDGTPTDLTILNADVQGEGPTPPEDAAQSLEDAALDAVRGMTFTPGEHEGQAVNAQMAVPIRFQLPE